MKSVKFILSILIISLFVGNTYAYRHISPYAYCAGDPVNLVDPDGRQTVVVGITNIPLLGTTDPIVLGRTPVMSSADKVVNTSKLGEAGKIGTEVGKTEIHHLIPRALRYMHEVKKAIEGGFRMNGKNNLKEVPKYSKETGTGRHGNHPNYTRQVEKQVKEEISKDATPQEASEGLQRVADKMSQEIDDNPSVKINDIKVE